MILLMDLQSFYLREDLQTPAFVPLINILLFTLLLATVMKIPLVWSGIISVTGYFLYVLLQVLIVQLSFGVLAVSELQLHPERLLSADVKQFPGNCRL